MIKYIIIIFILSGCVDKTTAKIQSKKDSILKSNAEPIVQYDRLQMFLLSSDSVILFSHLSPNMLAKNPNTGKYYSHSISFIEDGKINYSLSVQERKQLTQQEIKELVDILTLPAVDEIVKTVCFQPRNAVVAFNDGQLSCYDFCFECFGFSYYGNFDSGLIMNNEKYEKLFDFYKKYGFKYEMD